MPGPFLGNGSVNTFPQQQQYSNRAMVFSVVCAAAVAMQRRGTRTSAATNPDTIEELCFYVVCAEMLEARDMVRA
jgi:hypothetical protein